MCTNVYQPLYMCIRPNVYECVSCPVYVYQTQCVRMCISPYVSDVACTVHVYVCQAQCVSVPASDPMFNRPYVRVSDTMSTSSGARASDTVSTSAGARVSGSMCTLTQRDRQVNIPLIPLF